MAKGATLYVDFPEVNPPLIIWLNMPCAWLAQHLGVADATVFRLMIATLGLVSVAWSGAILCRTLDKNDVWAWLAIGIYTVVVLPGYEFGQREHIAYLSVLPYLAEAACRLSGKRGSMVEHVAVALLAVIGVAIKPHFLLVPLLVEGAIISMTRRMPGTGVVVAMTLLVCYAASVHWLAPEYFNMLQLLAGSYWRNSEPWLGFVALPQFYCVAILLAITWFVRTKSRPVACVISFAVLGFALAAILQHKGWSYHWIPAMALGWILFGLAVSKAVAHRGAAVPLIITVLVAALASWNLLGAFRKGEKINPYPALLAPVIREMGGGPVIVFSNFEASFPLVTLPGIGTSSRFPTMTILGAVALDDNLKARKWIERSFVTDFRKQPPRLLLVETDERGIPVFDFVAYFAPLVPEISAYHKVRQVDKFQVLEAPDAHQRKFGIGL
ncbi:hypothetical protein ACHMW6_22475 [Pseudoduganella sp. UC29_106]|uniref:hypothetical protein n=1 Tax=Pseudoduganella sp. UC29_106 TaxID=3374553 RepID=UPI003757C577